MASSLPVGQSARTWLVSVLFIDIVGYSKEAVERQLKQKDVLNKAISDSIQDLAQDDRVILDTGDGAAICFLSDPEAALNAGLAIHKALYEANKLPGCSVIVRMGINLGPVKLVKDLNGQLNAVGDGINVGQRIMSFAADGQLTASRSFVEVVACLSAENEKRFELLGPKKDKHSREHVVYLVRCPNSSPVPLVTSSAVEPAAAAVYGMTPEFIQAVREELSLALGPIAAVLTKRLAKVAPSPREFVDLLGSEIEEKGDQKRFLTRARQLVEQLVPPLKVEDTTGRVDVACVGEKPAAPYCPLTLDGTTLGDVERALCSYIGPVGRLLVRKALSTVSTAPELYKALADHIPEAADRKAFLSGCSGV
jgi:class 3 adenylate cyclase